MRRLSSLGTEPSDRVIAAMKTRPLAAAAALVHSHPECFVAMMLHERGVQKTRQPTRVNEGFSARTIRVRRGKLAFVPNSYRNTAALGCGAHVGQDILPGT